MTVPKTSSDAEAFWNRVYAGRTIAVTDDDRPVIETAHATFGDLNGRRLLDVGCGNGSSSIFFAERGACVTALDTSQTGITALRRYCDEHGVTGVEPLCASAFDIADLGPFDFIYGAMILHHLEPFPDFVEVLRRALKPEGKAFFYENSAMSGLLIWCRERLVGRFGIPKHGDDEETPLTPGEVSALRKRFHVEVFYPEFFFVRLVSMYLLKGRFDAQVRALDRALFRVKPLRRYSYRQCLKLSEGPGD